MIAHEQAGDGNRASDLKPNAKDAKQTPGHSLHPEGPCPASSGRWLPGHIGNVTQKGPEKLCANPKKAFCGKEMPSQEESLNGHDIKTASASEAQCFFLCHELYLEL
jgi:hypothetical protein